MGEVHDLVMRLGLEAARTNAQSAAERRQVDLAAEIMAEESDAVGLAYSGFCMTSFPHRQLADQHAQWIRTNGRFSLMVEPGALLIQGRPIHFGVPHGSRARMIMLYLTTQAVQKQTKTIELGGSLFEWMRKMAVPIGGANYRAVKEQAMRISACRLTVGWRNDSGVEGFQRENIVKGMVMVPDDMTHGQGKLWRDTVEITDWFLRSACYASRADLGTCNPEDLRTLAGHRYLCVAGVSAARNSQADIRRVGFDKRAIRPRIRANGRF